MIRFLDRFNDFGSNEIDEYREEADKEWIAPDQPQRVKNGKSDQ